MKPLVAGVAGWPIAHSLSPFIHKAWIEALGLDAFYVPLPIRPQQALEAFKALPSLGFSGVNVTLPLKRKALEAALRHHISARRTGATNLLVVQEGGLMAHNTDVEGFLEGLKQGAPPFLKKALEHQTPEKNAQARSLTALVLGAGGAARAVVVALLDIGCFDTIFIASRTTQTADALKDSMRNARIITLSWEGRHTGLANAHLLVNATPCGMVGYPLLDLDLGHVSRETCLYDLVTTPVETPLLRKAHKHGLHTIDGLTMLIEQARPSFKALYGRAPPEGFPMREHVLNLKRP